MMDTSGFCRHIGKLREGSLAHLVIPLIVIFKGGQCEKTSPTGCSQQYIFKVKCEVVAG